MLKKWFTPLGAVVEAYMPIGEGHANFGHEQVMAAVEEARLAMGIDEDTLSEAMQNFVNCDPTDIEKATEAAEFVWNIVTNM